MSLACRFTRYLGSNRALIVLATIYALAGLSGLTAGAGPVRLAGLGLLVLSALLPLARPATRAWCARATGGRFAPVPLNLGSPQRG
jgi:hypothetical protein